MIQAVIPLSKFPVSSVIESEIFVVYLLTCLLFMYVFIKVFI